MNRRESLVCLSTLAGHALFPQVLERFGLASLALARGAEDWRPELLSPEQGRLVAEIVETIIPETDTPGAKAARVHVFVDLMLARCVPAADSKAVLEALDDVGEPFLQAAPADRQERLGRMDAKTFALVKELTLVGYFTSKVGATQALAYDAVPGSYRGCIDLKPGQRAWATR
jgi:hypothetical protein